MSRYPTFIFQLSIISIWLVKHIITKFSMKISIRKRHIYIDIRWPWIWNQYFCLGIWNDDRTKKIVLPSFQLATRLKSQNRNENDFINEGWLFNLYMNIWISNWHNWSFDPTKMNFFYFISVPYTITDLQVPEPHLYIPRGAEWRLVNNVLFTSWKCEKKISWNLKTKCLTDFLWTVKSSSMKDYTCHYGVCT